MKDRPDGTGYLVKGSGTSWADCLTVPVTTNDDSGDTDYLYAGLRYYTTAVPTQNWRIQRPFFSFTLPVIGTKDEVVSAKLRLWLAEYDNTQAGTFRLYLLLSGYGTLEAADWDLWSGESYVEADLADVGTEGGVNYLDFTLSGALLSAITTGATIAFELIRHEDEAATDPETAGSCYLKTYSATYATATLRPHIEIITRCHRERIIEATITRLKTISEFSGYTNTVDADSVTRVEKAVNDILELECPHITVRGDGPDEREPFPSYRFESDWEFALTPVVWARTKPLLQPTLNEFIRDIERCIEADPSLGLPAATVHCVAILKIETTEDYIIDDNRAFAVVWLRVKYTHIRGG